MALRGQNLRIFVGDRAVAAALNATIHATVSTNGATTKDTNDSFDEIEPGTKSVEVSTEALYMTDDYVRRTIVTDTPIGVGLTTWYTDGNEITLHPGDVIKITNDEKQVIILIDTDGTAYAQGQEPGRLEMEVTSDRVVYIATRRNLVQLKVKRSNAIPSVLAGDFIRMLIAESLVKVTLSETYGNSNRLRSNVILEFYAHVVDMSISAQNDQLATFSIQLKSKGELTLPSASKAMAMLLDEDEMDTAEAPTEE